MLLYSFLTSQQSVVGTVNYKYLVRISKKLQRRRNIRNNQCLGTCFLCNIDLNRPETQIMVALYYLRTRLQKAHRLVQPFQNDYSSRTTHPSISATHYIFRLRILRPTSTSVQFLHATSNGFYFRKLFSILLFALHVLVVLCSVHCVGFARQLSTHITTEYELHYLYSFQNDTSSWRIVIAY